MILSLRRLVLHPRSVHVGFVVNKVALGQIFLQVLWFSPNRNNDIFETNSAAQLY